MAKKNEEFLSLGRITRTQGLRGEVKLEVWTDYPEEIISGRMIWLEYQDGERKPLVVEKARALKGALIVKLEGIDEVSAAEGLRGAVMQIPESEAHHLEEGEYWEYQLIDCKVITDDGHDIGMVSEIIKTGSNDVLVVRGETEQLIPMIKDVVLEIDIDEKIISIKPMPGLLSEEA